jgi:DNA helicase-2/ATP-dependent DNA helicase PcrA
MNKIEKIVELIKTIHSEDKEQIGFVLSDKKRIIVTAPAGCGKTRTMISKIAYELSTNKTMNLKKILALTFSVNAATKIKEDTIKLLPELLCNKDVDISRKLDVSNYHSFATILLRKHGFLLNEHFKEIQYFIILSESSSLLKEYLTPEEINVLLEYDNCLKKL